MLFQPKEAGQLGFTLKKLIAQEVNEDSALLSMVPELGPFHVTLNGHKDIMQSYHFVLSQVYRETFGSQFSHKPKPFWIKLLLNAISLRWLQLRTKILQKFQLCKDMSLHAYCTYWMKSLRQINPVYAK